MSKTYSLVMKFKKNYPTTLAFRLKQHCSVVDKHLNPGEEIKYVFPAQKNNNFWEIFNTTVVVLTTKRMLFATKRVLWGYFLTSVTPDMFNDLSINNGLIWGNVVIDTAKEVITLSNVPSAALDEIETNISEYMMEEKKKYVKREDKQ